MSLRTITFKTISACAVALCVACSSRVDVSTVPVGARVQVTEQSGAVVDGTLSERDDSAITVKASTGPRRVLRNEIADLQVITRDRPATLPSMAKFREYTVADGTMVQLTLNTSASSETSQVGDSVEATLADGVEVADVVVLPEGSTLKGTVTEATSAGKVKGRARLALHFDEIAARDERYPIAAGISVEAPSTKKKDAATIGIPAAAGAIIGGILGGGKGAAAGAAIGGGGGTAVVLLTEGKPVEFNKGISMRLTLKKDVIVRVPVR